MYSVDDPKYQSKNPNEEELESDLVDGLGSE